MAFQHVGQCCVGVHLEGLGLWVQVGLARGKQHIAARSLQLCAIGLPGAGVAVKVLVRQKLEAVHKDAGHRHVAQGLGLAHQGDVPVVQVAHGGHKGGVAIGGQGLAQVCNGAGNQHGVGEVE
ncbi:hypothetical protein D3C71_1311600 [compost metagenome]